MKNLKDKEISKELERLSAENQLYKQECELLIKQLELVNKKLQDAERFKTNFLSNIRNEINNPIGAVLGLAGNMKNIDPSKLEKIRKMSDLIYADIKELDFQLQNIFIAADLEAGEAKPEITRVNLSNLLDGTIDLIKNKLSDKQLRLEKKLNFFTKENNENFFKTDPWKLQLVLLNLLMNAIHSSSSGQRIFLRLTSKEGALTISITDFGSELNKDESGKIINRFEKTKGLFDGTKGRGLAVTRDLLEIISGTIEVKSRVKEVKEGEDSEGSSRFFKKSDKLKETTFIIKLKEMNEVSESIFGFGPDDVLFKF
jgi:signal transduction histidine kinase